MPLDHVHNSQLDIDVGVDIGSTRMCTRYSIDCPARCNGWVLPCVDEPGFEASLDGDLSASQAIYSAMILAFFAWSAVAVWFVMS